jgi:hypothetical protein
MRKLALGTTILAALALVLMPMKASALLELDLGFDPTEACPGDEVHFFFSLENVGDESEMVNFAITITWNDEVFGPFEGDFEMPAGEEFAREFMFLVPSMIPPGTLTLTVTATDSDGMVEDEAVLEILDCGGNDKQNPKPLVNVLRKHFRQYDIK